MPPVTIPGPRRSSLPRGGRHFLVTKAILFMDKGKMQTQNNETEDKSMKTRAAALGVGAMVIGTAGLFVASFISWPLGLALLTVPVWMVYKAS